MVSLDLADHFLVQWRWKKNRAGFLFTGLVGCKVTVERETEISRRSGEAPFPARIV